MNRRNFIKSMGVVMVTPQLALSSDAPPIQLPGYLLPTSLSSGMDKLFKDFAEPAKEVVKKGLTTVMSGTYPVSKAYKEHYSNSVQKHLGTKKLNGVGVNGDDSKMKVRMNDDNVVATTATHSARDLKNFNQKDWENYCDISLKQLAEDTDGKPRLYITAKDSRQESYKETFWIPENLMYLVYNPTYYCYGLPIESPQINEVSDSLQRDILQKIGRTSTTKSYYSQQFLFYGQAACGTTQNEFHKVVWGHDQAIKEFYGITEIKGCGDPNVQCKGEPSSRPKIPAR